MAAKADKFYYDNLNAAVDCACKAADYLVTCFSNYNSSKLKEMLEKIHGYEHAADEKKHEMSEALAKAFITPVDREDLALISRRIDDVTDNIEEVLQCFYMYQIGIVTEEAITFAQKIVEACEIMKALLAEFVNFKKPAKLHELIIKINDKEGECDELFMESTLKLNEQFENVLDLISWRRIYSKMEDCADACEHVADCIDMVVMKNT